MILATLYGGCWLPGFDFGVTAVVVMSVVVIVICVNGRSPLAAVFGAFWVILRFSWTAALTAFVCVFGVVFGFVYVGCGWSTI